MDDVAQRAPQHDRPGLHSAHDRAESTEQVQEKRGDFSTRIVEGARLLRMHPHFSQIAAKLSTDKLRLKVSSLN